MAGTQKDSGAQLLLEGCSEDLPFLIYGRGCGISMSCSGLELGELVQQQEERPTGLCKTLSQISSELTRK